MPSFRGSDPGIKPTSFMSPALAGRFFFLFVWFFFVFFFFATNANWEAQGLGLWPFGTIQKVILSSKPHNDVETRELQ